MFVSKGQGITQEDVAVSLFNASQAPHGGLPKTIYLDNGSEYSGIGEGIDRLAAIGGIRQIKSPPYAPESQCVIEGAFGVLEGTFIKTLPGHIGGDRMNSPTKSVGQKIDPYPGSLKDLKHDLERAVAQYNGTPQDGRLKGLSPKALLEQRIGETGFSAIQPDADTFDLVFSKAVDRKVRNGQINLNNRAFSGDVLTECIGETLQVLRPLRNPNGPPVLLRNGTIYRLYQETFDHTDGEGAKRQAELARMQRATIASMRNQADLSVDVPALFSANADLAPVASNPPERWTLQLQDKSGRLYAPRSDAEMNAMEDEQDAELIDEFLAQTKARDEQRSADGAADL